MEVGAHPVICLGSALPGLKELNRKERKGSQSKGESGGQEGGSTNLPSSDLWDKRMMRDPRKQGVRLSGASQWHISQDSKQWG